MSELVIVGVSSVITAALTFIICKLIVSYIDNRAMTEKNTKKEE